MRMECARIKRFDVRGAPCDKDDDACAARRCPQPRCMTAASPDTVGERVICAVHGTGSSLTTWNSYCLVCLSCELCCVVRVLYGADPDTWTPSISIRGPSRRAISRLRNRKLGLALYA